MSKAPNRTIKNKFADCNKGKNSMSVGEYLEKIYYRNSFGARCINGVCEVDFHGHWISLEQFNELVPIPVVAHFSHDKTNIDGTRKWMYE